MHLTERAGVDSGIPTYAILSATLLRVDSGPLPTVTAGGLRPMAREAACTRAAGEYTCGATPDPIPNSVVKPARPMVVLIGQE